MQHYNPSRETDVQERLYPSKDHSRYYILTQLTNTLHHIGKKYLQGKKLNIYDLGCGIMPYKSLFEQYTDSYRGIDLPGNELADVQINDTGKADLADESADVILSNQVLEHVSSPSQYLKECYRLLKSDGMLICSTHGFWKYHPDPNDYWRWTGEGLRKVITDNGFSVVETIGICNLASLSMILLQDALTYKFRKKSYAKSITRIFQWAIEFMDKRIKGDLNNEASVFVVVATKSNTNGKRQY